MPTIPSLFKAAGAVFFLIGLVVVPIAMQGEPFATYGKIALYFAAAIVFWLWLRIDVRIHHVSRAWALAVGLGWLVAAVPVAPAYLLATRGPKKGAVAVLAFIGLVLGLFALFCLGGVISVQIANAFRVG